MSNSVPSPGPRPAQRLDQIIQYIQDYYPAWELHRLTADADSSQPWIQVLGATVVRSLVVDEANVLAEIDQVPLQVAYWGRLLALARRVVDVHERRYRTWVAERWEEELAKAAGEKKPTDKAIESAYRRHRDYSRMKREVESAVEARDACEATLKGFLAKQEVLTAHAPLYRELAGVGR